MEELYNRRSIRKYTSEEVSHDIIEQVIDAARVAPSGKNKQPWKYLVYEQQAKEEILAAMEQGLNQEKEESNLLPGARHGLSDAFNTLRIMKEAPVTILVLNTDDSSPFQPISYEKRITEIIDTLSIGASIQNLLLKACELGLGTLWIGNTFFAYSELEAFIKTNHQIVGAIALGYPRESPLPRPRKSLDDIVEFYR